MNFSVWSHAKLDMCISWVDSKLVRLIIHVYTLVIVTELYPMCIITGYNVTVIVYKSLRSGIDCQNSSVCTCLSSLLVMSSSKEVSVKCSHVPGDTELHIVMALKNTVCWVNTITKTLPYMHWGDSNVWVVQRHNGDCIMKSTKVQTFGGELASYSIAVCWAVRHRRNQ